MPARLSRRLVAAPLVTLTIVAAVLSCSGVTEPSNVPRQLRVLGDSAPIGTVGADLAAPFAVQLIGSRGPIAGRPIRFAVVEGDGAVSDTVVATDGAGRAATVVTLGRVAGRQRFSATFAGIGSVELRALAKPGAPASVNALEGDAQRDTVGRKLAYPLRAVVHDAYANVVPDVAVSWTVAAGLGTLDSATSHSDSSGVARMGYTLGLRARVDTIQATIANVSSPARFTERSLPRTVAQLAIVQGAGQSVSAGAVASVAPMVRAIAADGTPVLDAEVTFTPSVGAAITVVADTQGIAGLTTWTVSTRAGADSLVANAGAALAVIGATVTPGAPGRLVVVAAPPDSVISGRPFARPLGVAVADSFANPIAAASANVTVAVEQGGGTLAGTPTVATSNGVATFGDLQVSGGGPHTLRATAPGLDAALSRPFVVLVAPTVLAYDSTVVVLAVGDTVTPALVVRDSAGLLVGGAQIGFVARNAPVVGLAPSGTVGGLQRGQSLVVATSQVSPQMRDSLLAVVAAPGAPVVRTDLADFVVAPDSALDVVVYADMRGSTRAGSASVDVRWTPSQLTYVSSDSVAGGVSPVVGDGGAAGGILRLAFADADGFTGRVPLIRIHFRAASSAPVTGSIELTVRELGAADASFTALGPGTTGVTHPLVVRR